jgi:two-component system response regulator YesN
MDLLSVLDVTKEKKLLSDIRANDLGAALSVLDDIFEKLKIWKPSMKESQIVFVDLLGILNRACRERSIDISSVYPDQRPPQKVFENFCSIQEAQEWFESLFVKLINADQSASMLPDSENVLAAVRYIQKHYGEDISLSKIAEAVGLSCNYLSKQFKEQMHIGFSNYIIEYRLEKAKLFLASDNQSIKMVAIRCGFQDEAYFSRVFKKHTGMTPKEYQKDQKNN